ncbi:adenine-specific methyltransferase [Lentilactobacillus kosonis]|uniref:Adenine-specific methyltransferase n=2 Tax=Lentilactobacillus kosonis TaxID=2810561 RepID=A0A401FL88_9LACO|nr:adenine-specific methyltransferase [Lentilactobacillus kosonis]
MILKVSKSDRLQANYQLTPDTIGDVVSYIASGLLENRQSLSILDPAMGTGNLLTTVINGLTNNIDVSVHPYGLENDDAMFEIAAGSFELQQIQADLYHEDAITDVMVPKVDLIVSDLPIGYYPIDENVTNFETKAEKGHSFVHHLFLEMAANHLSDGGIGIFLVPSAIFKSDEAKSLLKWMQGKVYLQGLLNLPKDLFANEAAQKSILILQKLVAVLSKLNQSCWVNFRHLKMLRAFKRFLLKLMTGGKRI